MNGRGLVGRFSSLKELFVDCALPGSEVTKIYLRRLELRQQRPPYDVRFGDVVAGLDGSFCLSTGSAGAGLEGLTDAWVWCRLEERLGIEWCRVLIMPRSSRM